MEETIPRQGWTIEQALHKLTLHERVNRLTRFNQIWSFDFIIDDIHPNEFVLSDIVRRNLYLSTSEIDFVARENLYCD